MTPQSVDLGKNGRVSAYIHRLDGQRKVRCCSPHAALFTACALFLS